MRRPGDRSMLIHPTGAVVPHPRLSFCTPSTPMTVVPYVQLPTLSSCKLSGRILLAGRNQEADESLAVTRSTSKLLLPGLSFDGALRNPCWTRRSQGWIGSIES
jgi:hypothetical protein